MQPKSPNQDFDFMLKENPQPKSRSSLLSFSKPIKIGLAVIGGLILIAVVGSLLSGRGGSNQPIVNALSRGEETLRVTAVAQQLNLQDPQIQALASTVTNTLTSDDVQIKGYLTKNNVKLTRVQLATSTDKTADTSLQTASQNNNLDSAYVNYLKEALAKYQSDIEIAYKSAGPNGKVLLNDAYESVTVLLATPPLKS